MESFPAEVWTLILRGIGELEIKELLKSTKLVRSKIFQGLREYHSSSLAWPLSFIEKMPSLVSFTSHGPIQDWSRLSLLPKKLKSFCGGYISGQDAPDFRGSQLRELSVSTAFISWNIVNSLPKALTKLVVQECRYFGDELFAVLPRSLVSLKILNRERNCACGVKGGEYESSSFITDMAFLDLPTSLTDLEVHSSRAFSDLALKLLKPTLVHLCLTPTVFTPTGTFYMPPELETIDFSNQSGPVEIPPETKVGHISSVKLGTVVLDSLARLPTTITRLDIQSCPGLLFSLHLTHCRHLTSLVIPSLFANDVSVLPRTLLSVKILNGFTAGDSSQINDNNAHEFPPRLNTLVISSKLHAPAVYYLPRSLTCYSFQGNFGIVQSAVSLGELLTEEPFLLAQSKESQILVSGTSTSCKPIHNEHFAEVPLETYLSWLRSRRELRLTSGSLVKGHNLAFGYSFSQRESAKFTSATVPHSILFQAYQGSGRLFCDNPLPTSLTSLTIASNMHSVRFSGKWLLPSSLLTLRVGSKIILDEVTTDMSLREAWRREVPDRPTLLTPHDEQAQEGTEFYDSADEKADYVSSIFAPGDVDSASASPSAGTSNADIRPATASLSDPSYAIDSLLQLDPEHLQAQWKEAMMETTLMRLELPPRLTCLSLGLSLGPVTIPLTVTELSFSVVHVDPICFLTIFALPATIRNLSIVIHSNYTIPTSQSALQKAYYTSIESSAVVSLCKKLQEVMLLFESSTSSQDNPNQSTQLPTAVKPSRFKSLDSVKIPEWMKQLMANDGIIPIFLLLAARLSTLNSFSLLSTSTQTEQLSTSYLSILPSSIENVKIGHKRLRSSSAPPLNSSLMNPSSTSSINATTTLSTKPSIPPSANYPQPNTSEHLKYQHKRGSYISRAPNAIDPPCHPLDSTLCDDDLNALREDLELTTLRLYTNKTLGQSGLSGLPSNLTTLVIWSNPNISDGIIPQLPKALTHLSLSSSNLTERCIQDLPQSLLVLEMSGANLADEVVSLLPRGLKTLNMRSNTKFTSECVISLPPQLERLSLFGNGNFSDDCLIYLPRTLQVLNLSSNMKITDKGIQSLPRDLMELWLTSNTNISGKSVPFLPRSILLLALSATTRLDAQCLSLMPPYLTRLHIDKCYFTPQQLIQLPKTLARLRTSIAKSDVPFIVEALPLLAYDLVTIRV